MFRSAKDTGDVTATRGAFYVVVTLTVYLAKWNEYGAADSFNKKGWDGLLERNKAHEEVHVLIFKMLTKFVENRIPSSVKTPNQLMVHSRWTHAWAKIDTINKAFDELDTAVRSGEYETFGPSLNRRSVMNKLKIK